MDEEAEEDAVYICSGILLSHQKEWDNATCKHGWAQR